MISPLYGNLAYAVSTLIFWRLAAAVVSGTLLALAFPPLSWNLLAWVAFIPIVFVPQPRRRWERLLIGYIFGYTHFAISLFWLNEVGFGAGFLLSLWCALFPMLWYYFLSSLFIDMKDPKAAEIPGESILFIRANVKLALVALLAAASWTALEWVRSWLFSGFSWNQLGISQYTRHGLIQTAAYTGPYGASFFIVLVNMVLVGELAQIVWMILAHRRRTFPWHVALLALAFIPVCICANLPEHLPAKDTPMLDTLVVQPNLPQSRFWTESIYLNSFNTLKNLTEQSLAAAEKQPDVVIWPECAVPAPLNYPDYRVRRNELFSKYQSQFLVGATHQRQSKTSYDGEAFFNCAFLINPQADYKKTLFDPADKVIDYYDKVHRVPFGEYTPFSKIFPWLVDFIGMGRDLTPGRSFHVMDLPNGARAGVNICFEDAFPYVSRAFARQGANILMTITNDSWYNQSCGAHQHMSHVVFRAVENRRPFLRCGSNSHSCLISPNGRVFGMLRDNEHDSDFIAATRFYYVPVKDNWGMTFYTKYGDVFARLCALLTAGAVAIMLSHWLSMKKSQLESIKANTRPPKNVKAKA